MEFCILTARRHRRRICLFVAGKPLSTHFFTPNTPGAKVLSSTNGLPVDLASGANIGPGAKFGKGRSYGVLFEYHHYNKFIGPFRSLQPGYVGFQFSEQGQTHYGWMRLQVTRQGHSYPSLVLSQFGYESAPNTAVPSRQLHRLNGGCRLRTGANCQRTTRARIARSTRFGV
jgi:hypothetical protein